MLQAQILLNLEGFDKLKDRIASGIGSPEISTMLKRWRVIYLSFVHLRALAASRGNGTWAPLAPSTIRRRRRAAPHKRKRQGRASRQAARSSKRVGKKALRRVKASEVSSTRNRASQSALALGQATGGAEQGRSLAILKDKGILLNVLNPTVNMTPGSYTEYNRFSVLVGYGGAATHPSGYATVAGIAEAHQLGNPRRNLPKREIIVQPDLATRTLMQSQAQVALNLLVNRTSKKK